MFFVLPIGGRSTVHALALVRSYLGSSPETLFSAIPSPVVAGQHWVQLASSG